MPPTQEIAGLIKGLLATIANIEFEHIFGSPNEPVAFHLSPKPR